MNLNRLSKHSFTQRADTRRYLHRKLPLFLRGATLEAGTDTVMLAYSGQERTRVIRKRVTAQQCYAEVMALVTRSDTGMRRIGLKVGKRQSAILLMANPLSGGFDLIYGIEE